MARLICAGGHPPHSHNTAPQICVYSSAFIVSLQRWLAPAPVAGSPQQKQRCRSSRGAAAAHFDVNQSIGLVSQMNFTGPWSPAMARVKPTHAARESSGMVTQIGRHTDVWTRHGAASAASANRCAMLRKRCNGRPTSPDGWRPHICPAQRYRSRLATKLHHSIQCCGV